MSYHGCRVFCRLVEHGSNAALVGEVLVEVEAIELSRHGFGHHVMKTILEHGNSYERFKIIKALCIDLLHNMKNHNASCVIATAVTYCSAEELKPFVIGLLADSRTLTSLAQNQFGCHILRGLAKLLGQAPRKLLDSLQLSTQQFQGTKYGQKLLEELLQNGILMTASAAAAAA